MSEASSSAPKDGRHVDSADTTIGAPHCLRLLMEVVNDVLHDVTGTKGVTVATLVDAVTDRLTSRARHIDPLDAARTGAVAVVSPGVVQDRATRVAGFERRGSERRPHHQSGVVADALGFIKTECHRSTLTLRDVAKQVELTPSYIDRLLTRYTGSSFVVHRTVARLGRATHLLATTRLSVKEVAGAAGYNHVSTFDRAFVRMFDCTPTEWRDRLAQPHGGPSLASARPKRKPRP